MSQSILTFNTHGYSIVHIYYFIFRQFISTFLLRWICYVYVITLTFFPHGCLTSGLVVFVYQTHVFTYSLFATTNRDL